MIVPIMNAIIITKKHDKLNSKKLKHSEVSFIVFP